MNTLKQLLEHLAKQYKLNPTATKLVYYLYNNRKNRDVFPWTSKHTSEAAVALNITHESIKKAMLQLVKANLILKTDRATYQYALPELNKSKVILTYEFSNKNNPIIQIIND